MKVIEVTREKLLVAVGSVVFVVSTTDNNQVVKVIRNDKSGDSHVVTMTVAKETGNLYVGYSNKMVTCWDLTTMEMIGCSTLRKQPTAIQYGSFTADSMDRHAADGKRKYDVLLASDKAGEVFALDAPQLKKQSLLAGHTASVITDMAIHQGLAKSFVATADRDEKIRISHFPDMENIHTFCLGHTNVVSSVTFAEVNNALLLLTTGWDNKLNLWDIQGNLLQSISFLSAEASSSAAVEHKSATDDVDVDAEADINADVEEAAEEGAEGAADADGDGEEDLEGKVYDEKSAGNYPMKVVCSAQLPNHSATVAVIFKGTTALRLYTLHHDAKIGKFQLADHSSVVLAAVPVDLVFSKDNELSVVVPKPQGLQVFQVGASTVDVSSKCAYIAKLVEAADEQGLDFALPDGSSSTHNATGMKKHTLDKRYNSEENIKSRTGRGAKRSKRPNRGQQEA